MGIVSTMCPTTGKQVSTGVNLDRRAFRMLPASRHFSFHCWLCGHEHEWDDGLRYAGRGARPGIRRRSAPLGIGGAPHALFTSVRFVDL